jgi:hypothetical protein
MTSVVPVLDRVLDADSHHMAPCNTGARSGDLPPGAFDFTRRLDVMVRRID